MSVDTSQQLAYGSESQRCIFHKSTRNHDLYPLQSTPRLTVAARQYNAASITVPVKQSVLVIVDMMNLFLHPKYYNNERGRAAIPKLVKVLRRCRELQMKVIWLNWGLTEDDLTNLSVTTARAAINFDAGTRQGEAPWSGAGCRLDGGAGRKFMAGTWNADIFDELKAHVAPDDLHCTKTFETGATFAEQPLRRSLVELGASTLFLAGVNTDQCVMTTMTGAGFAGYNCVLLKDCCAGSSVAKHDAAVDNAAGPYGFVTDSESFCDAALE